MTKKKYVLPYEESMEFHRIKGYDLQVAHSGEGQGKITVFRAGLLDPMIERVPGSQILVMGKTAKAELLRLITEESRRSIADKQLIPGGIAGRAYNALRAYLLHNQAK